MILVMGGAHRFAKIRGKLSLLQLQLGPGYQFVKQKGPFDPGAADPFLQLKFLLLGKIVGMWVEWRIQGCLGSSVPGRICSHGVRVFRCGCRSSASACSRFLTHHGSLGPPLKA